LISSAAFNCYRYSAMTVLTPEKDATLGSDI